MKTIYTNGAVFTGQLPLCEAFSVENGRFAEAGSNEQLLENRQDGDAGLDLQGKFVCARFNESHMHLLNYGYSMECCDLSAHTGSLAELQDGMRAFMAAHDFPEGAWVMGRGWNQDYFAGAHEIPTRYDLDKISSDRPVCIVRCCGHCMVINSKALELMGLRGDEEQPEGGHFDLDAQGVPNGIFRDNAMTWVYRHIPQPNRADVKRMIRSAVRELNRCGITSVQTDDLIVFRSLGYEEVIAAYKELEQEGALTVRVYEQSHFSSLPELRSFIEKGYKTGVGDALFKIGPLKLMSDGSLGARTAFLREDYADAPGERGLSVFDQQTLDELVSYAHKEGMQIAIHSIGDGSLDQVLTAYERAFAAFPREDHRSGVVHVQITHPEQLDKMRDLSLVAYIQSIFLDYDIHIVSARVGEELASTSYAFHSMKTRGIPTSNGTDCPVERPDPMRGIQCAVTRCTLRDYLGPYCPQEAMTVEEALQSYTSAGAYASFEEKVKGQIAPGMLADFVILSGNPFDTPADRLGEITALETYLGGECVFRADK